MSDDAGTMRLDRLVAEPTPDGAGLTWWVIDYKLNHDPLSSAAYHQQMARYVAAVERVQPGDRVAGGFITGEGKWLLWQPSGG